MKMQNVYCFAFSHVKQKKTSANYARMKVTGYQHFMKIRAHTRIDVLFNIETDDTFCRFLNLEPRKKKVTEIN